MKIQALLSRLKANFRRSALSCTHFMLMASYAAFVVGTNGQDILSDAGQQRDYVYAEKGNDILVYTPSLNSNKKVDYYDGGQGIDTLWLRMTQAEYESPSVRADLIEYHYFILTKGDHLSKTDQGPVFKFQSFHLNVRNIENVVVERIHVRDGVIPRDFYKEPLAPIKSPEDADLV